MGQVNGLSVLDLGEYSFGRLLQDNGRGLRGQKGVINIERK